MDGLQAIITGRLRKDVREFYGMTFREIENAIKGFEKLKEEQFQEYMIGVRKICFHTNRSFLGKKGFKKESDVFPLEIDKAIRRERIKKMKPVVITRTIKKDGQQSNG